MFCLWAAAPLESTSPSAGFQSVAPCCATLLSHSGWLVSEKHCACTNVCACSAQSTALEVGAPAHSSWTAPCIQNIDWERWADAPPSKFGKFEPLASLEGVLEFSWSGLALLEECQTPQAHPQACHLVQQLHTPSDAPFCGSGKNF